MPASKNSWLHGGSPYLALHTSQVLHPIPPEKDKHDAQANVTWELYFRLAKYSGKNTSGL